MLGNSSNEAMGQAFDKLYSDLAYQTSKGIITPIYTSSALVGKQSTLGDVVQIRSSWKFTPGTRSSNLYLGREACFSTNGRNGLICFSPISEALCMLRKHAVILFVSFLHTRRRCCLIRNRNNRWS